MLDTFEENNKLFGNEIYLNNILHEDDIYEQESLDCHLDGEGLKIDLDLDKIKIKK